MLTWAKSIREVGYQCEIFSKQLFSWLKIWMGRGEYTTLSDLDKEAAIQTKFVFIFHLSINHLSLPGCLSYLSSCLSIYLSFHPLTLVYTIQQYPVSLIHFTQYFGDINSSAVEV